MKYFQFRKGAKDDKPSFKFGEEAVNKVSGKLKWVFFNQPKTVTTKEWKSVTIPANINIVFENEQSVSFSVELWKLFRSVTHSILNADIGDTVELYTFINKEWYKSISVTNPSIKEKINYKWEEMEVSKNLFFVTKFEHPEIEIIKNKKWDFVSADDSEANEFFINKIKEKFGKKDNSNWEISVEDLPW